MASATLVASETGVVATTVETIESTSGATVTSGSLDSWPFGETVGVVLLSVRVETIKKILESVCNR